jgi:hypothetical protein
MGEAPIKAPLFSCIKNEKLCIRDARTGAKITPVVKALMLRLYKGTVKAFIRPG